MNLSNIESKENYADIFQKFILTKNGWDQPHTNVGIHVFDSLTSFQNQNGAQCHGHGRGGDSSQGTLPGIHGDGDDYELVGVVAVRNRNLLRGRNPPRWSPLQNQIRIQVSPHGLHAGKQGRPLLPIGQVEVEVGVVASPPGHFW